MRRAWLFLPLAAFLAPLAAHAEQAPGEKQPAASHSSEHGADTPHRRMVARRYARAGMQKLDAHRDADALALLRQASALVDAPTLKVLEGRALVRLNRLKEAEEAFRHAAHTQLPSDAPQVWVQARAQARRRLKDLSSRIPRIRIRSSGERAHVDGETVFLSGGEAVVRVDPGKHAVYRDRDRARIVELSQYEMVDVDLDETPTSAQRRWGWVSVGAGAAAVTGGVVLSAIAIHHKKELDASCSGSDCPASSQDDLARFRTERALAPTSYTVGIVGLGLGVVLLSSSRERESPRAARVSLTPVSASVSGSF